MPVLIDGNKTLHDSWKIAEYLDAEYPDLPLLFFEDTGIAVHACCQTVYISFVSHQSVAYNRFTGKYLPLKQATYLKQ